MRHPGTILAIVMGLAATLGPAAEGATILVDDDRVECPAAPFVNIQAAVDAAPPGASIRVCPGTYAEQVVISQSLTLRGENGAVVRPAGVTANSTSLFDGSPVAAVVLVTDASDVVLEGLTLDGADNGLVGCAPDFVGVFFRNASGRVAGAAVRNVQLGPTLEGCQSGTGIFVQSGGGGASRVEILANSVHHFQKNGITANEVGTSVRVRSNFVMGRGPGPGAAQNGIQIGFGATGQILENAVANHVWPGCLSVDDCEASATDVLVAESDGVTVARNTLGQSQTGIFVQGNNGLVQGNTVYDTDVFDGIAVLGNGNRILTNSIVRSDEAAVFLAGDGNAVVGNLVNEAAIGVWRFSGAGNVIARNRFANTPTPVLDTLAGAEPASPTSSLGSSRPDLPLGPVGAARASALGTRRGAFR